MRLVGRCKLENLWNNLISYDLGNWGGKLIPNTSRVGVSVSGESAGFLVAEIEYKYSTDTSKVLALNRHGVLPELVDAVAHFFSQVGFQQERLTNAPSFFVGDR